MQEGLKADIKATAGALDQERTLDALLYRVAALVPQAVTDGNSATEDASGSAPAEVMVGPTSVTTRWTRQGGGVPALLDVLVTAREHCSTQNPASLLAGCAAAASGLQG